jgi:hypothetical protein
MWKYGQQNLWAVTEKPPFRVAFLFGAGERDSVFDNGGSSLYNGRKYREGGLSWNSGR